MSHKKNAILGLRIISGLTIAIGLFGIAMAIAYDQSVKVFFVTVPGWVVGASVAYLGIRHWRKIPSLSKDIVETSTFSFANIKDLFSWTNFKALFSLSALKGSK